MALASRLTIILPLQLQIPPDDITDINISPDTITACSFVVQWEVNHPVISMCGTVWYTITISTEGGILIITDNTTMD